MPDLGYWLARPFVIPGESNSPRIANNRGIPSKDTLPLSTKNEA